MSMACEDSVRVVRWCGPWEVGSVQADPVVVERLRRLYPHCIVDAEGPEDNPPPEASAREEDEN